MSRPGPRAYLLITLVAFLLVLLPFLFWYATWFGRRLSDRELDRYFADTERPRRAQHALVQLGERLGRRQDVSRWYPEVVREASSASPELRQTAAWIMGQDRSYSPFHEALRGLLADPQPMVRRNAALALAGFGDPAARPELIAMLRPYRIAAPSAGALKYRVKPGEYVNPGTAVARIGGVDVRAPVPGEVLAADRPEATVHAGDTVAELSADKGHVWEALRALYLVGQLPDLEDVERYTRPLAGIPDPVRRQASLTAEAIRSRPAGP